MASGMRIAHLSDVHLLSLEGVAAGDFIANKRLLGGLNVWLNRGKHYFNAVFEAMVDDLNGQALDHIACTGDVTNLALEPEFRFARERFDRLALGPAEVTCIPGNHDKYVRRVGKMFEDIFAPYCAGDAGWEWSDGSQWPIVRVRGDVAVIAMCSSVPTWLLAAYGEVGGEQLARTERVLADPRLASKFRLVMIHHPPAGKYARSGLRGLRDHGEFAQVIARSGAELVLHGHEHLDLRHTLGGPGGVAIPVHGIQSASYDGGGERHHKQGRYRIYTIDGGAIVSEELRVFDRETHKFTSEGVKRAA